MSVLPTRSIRTNAQSPGTRLSHSLSFAAAVLLGAGCASQQTPPTTVSGKRDAAELIIVDCLLPGQVRKLGRKLTYLSPRRPIKTSASNCEIRGGEYVSYDRASYATALKVWLPRAKEGDPAAQTYAGEIYEKGLGVAPDYTIAARWYEKAAAQGYSRAQINLGYLYERGLGVPKDTVQALNMYRQASGLVEEGDLEFASSVELADRQAQRQELAELRDERDRRSAELETLRRQLEDTQNTLQQRRAAVESAQRDISELRARLANARPAAAVAGQSANQVTALKAELQRAERGKGALRAEIERQKQDSVALRERLDVVREQLDTHKQELRLAQVGLEETSAQLESQRALSSDANDEQVRSLDVLARQHATTVDAQRMQITRLEADLEKASQATGQREALTQRLAAAEQERRTVSEALARQAREAQQLRAELLGRDEELAQRRGALQSTQDELNRTRAKLGLQQAAQNQDQTVMQLLLAEIKQQEQQLKAQEREMLWLESEIEEQRDDLNVRLEAVAARERELQVALRDRESGMNGLRDELQQARLRLSGALEQLAAREQALESERRRTRMERQQMQQRQQITTLQAESQVTQLEKELRRREARIKQQREEIRRLQDQEQQRRARIVELKDAELTDAGNTRTADGAGPAIEIIEPPLVYTRGGPATVQLRSRLDAIEVIGRVDSPSQLLSFRVNDQTTEVDSNGLFAARVDMENPETPVNIVAIDKQGGRASVNFVLVPASSASNTASTPDQQSRPPLDVDFGRYHALVIGNNSYGHFPDLATPRNDATAVANMLRDRYGFKVTLLLDADRYQILSALNQLRNTLKDNDNLMIYYAGHGELDESNQRGHWLPVDAEPDDTTNWISNLTITDTLNVIPARHILVVADSCYSGSMTRSSVARLPKGIPMAARVKWYKAMNRIRARTALTSGGVKPVLDTGGGEHSIFAKAFLHVLDDNRDVLDGFRLYWEVQEQVRRSAAALRSNQIPQYAPLKYAGHESGEFFFLPASATVRRPDVVPRKHHYTGLPYTPGQS